MMVIAMPVDTREAEPGAALHPRPASGHVEQLPSRWKQTETTDQPSRCRATHPAGARRPSAEMKLRGRSGRSAAEGTSASLSRPGIDGELVAGVTSAVGNNINARGCGRGARPAGTP